MTMKKTDIHVLRRHVTNRNLKQVTIAINASVSLLMEDLIEHHPAWPERYQPADLL